MSMKGGNVTINDDVLTKLFQYRPHSSTHRSCNNAKRVQIVLLSDLPIRLH